MSINLPDFPKIIDSTIRSSFANCPRKFYWGQLRHLRKPGGNIHLLFGGAFARGLEVARKSYYRNSHSLDEALCDGLCAATEYWGDDGDSLVPERGSAANKTYDALVDALSCYLENWPLDTDPLQPYRLPNGEPFIEKTFAFPVSGTAHPVTGEPIVYCGRLDMLAVWRDTGMRVVVDEKTSTQLGDAWQKNWNLRGQISGYCHGASLYDIPVRGGIIRGVGILKERITFAESIQNREQWQVDAWLTQVRRDINRATDIWKQMQAENERNGNDGQVLHTHWDQNFDSVCSSYNGCEFMDLCTSHNPERWTGSYDEVIWEPLANRE